MNCLTLVEEIYFQHMGLWNTVILILVFGGMARIAFWREEGGLHVGGPLAVGLALLLTVATLQWARTEERHISEFGPLGAFVLIEAILIMAWAAFKKSSKT